MAFETQIASLPPEVQRVHRTTLNALTDIYESLPLFKSQIDTNKSSIDTINNTITSPSTASETTIVTPNIIGSVNDQSGETSYATQQSDYGAIIILSDASAIAVNLTTGPSIQLPWYCLMINEGVGLVTVTPATGTISFPNNLAAASMPLAQGQAALVVFDGSNFDAQIICVPPQDTPATAHEWIDAYDSITGIFTQTRPDYSDLTGLPQLPNTVVPVAGEYLTGYDATSGNFSSSTPVGVGGTIILAALTGGGTQGSITVTDGIITAFTNPT